MIADGSTWFVGKVVEYMSEPYQSWDAFVNAATLGIRMFFQLESKFSWMYFGASLLVGMGVYDFEKRKRNLGEGVSLARFIFPREVWGHPSAIVDYKFVAIDMTIKSLTYGPRFSGMTLCFIRRPFMSANRHGWDLYRRSRLTRSWLHSWSCLWGTLECSSDTTSPIRFQYFGYFIRSTTRPKS